MSSPVTTDDGCPSRRVEMELNTQVGWGGVVSWRGAGAAYGHHWLKKIQSRVRPLKGND